MVCKLLFDVDKEVYLPL